MPELLQEMYYGPNVQNLIESDDCKVMRLSDNSGEGMMTLYHVFPGVFLMYNDFHMKECISGFQTDMDLLCIDHCREGRIEQEVGQNAFSYLEAGDLRVDRRIHHSGKVEFPLCHYHGISIGFQVETAAKEIPAYIENFRNASKELKDIHIKVEKGYTPYNCLHLFVLKLASMGIVLVCAWQALQGQMSISVFLMFVLFSFVLFGSVENINDAAHTLGVIDSAMNKLEALENVNYIDQDGTDIKPATYDIEFRDVSFGYDSRIVLHDLNFKIPQNSTTAIVGPSGSGKSTLCNLIARFYDVNSGTITIGGTDIRRFTCDSLLKNISMVFQNVYLFRDTIKNNIKFGSPDATDEQIIAAAKAARCHDFIMALPDGYDTVIGEGGSSLSGGEKQRISIARAMLKDAPIIILDEATASIDPENEHLIQEAISALTHGKTIITIAHRLATIENADQILVIDGGTVAQRGTHKELLQQEGTYKKFIQIREQAEGWRIQ